MLAAIGTLRRRRRLDRSLRRRLCSPRVRRSAPRAAAAARYEHCDGKCCGSGSDAFSQGQSSVCNAPGRSGGSIAL